MTEYKDIPQPTDQRNVSQGDILNNFRYLINLTTTPIDGVLPVDHRITGNNTANPSDGFHNQVSFLNRTTPTTLVNAVNGQSSNAITYTTNDTAGNSQLHFYNGATGGVGGQMDYPISIVKAFVNFDATNAGIVIRSEFNVATVTRGFPATGVYIITFKQTLPNNNYIVLGTAGRNDNNFNVPSIISEYPDAIYGTHRTTTFVTVVNSNGAGLVNSSIVDIVIIGI